MRQRPVGRGATSSIGLGLTLLGMFGASAANVYQARDGARRIPLLALLAWCDGDRRGDRRRHRLGRRRAADVRTAPRLLAGLLYLALFASALAFSLYFPVVRKIGPAQGGLFERAGADHRHDACRPCSKAIAGRRWRRWARALALGGMLLAHRADRPSCAGARRRLVGLCVRRHDDAAALLGRKLAEMLRLPLHRHLHPRPPRRMVVEDQLPPTPPARSCDIRSVASRSWRSRRARAPRPARTRPPRSRGSG